MDKDSELWVIFQSIFIVLCYVNITIRYQERNVHAWAHTHTHTHSGSQTMGWGSTVVL